MHDFILQMALMGSLGAMAYLIARAVPRVSDGEAHREPHGKFDAWLGSLPLERVDAFLNTSLEKALRKTKIGVLKVDNLLTTYLNKVKAGNGKNGSPPAGGPAGLPGQGGPADYPPTGGTSDESQAS